MMKKKNDDREDENAYIMNYHKHGRTWVNLIVSIVNVIDCSMDLPTSSMPTHARARLHMLRNTCVGPYVCRSYYKQPLEVTYSVRAAPMRSNTPPRLRTNAMRQAQGTIAVSVGTFRCLPASRRIARGWPMGRGRLRLGAGAATMLKRGVHDR